MSFVTARSINIAFQASKFLTIACKTSYLKQIHKTKFWLGVPIGLRSIVGEVASKFDVHPSQNAILLTTVGDNITYLLHMAPAGYLTKGWILKREFPAFSFYDAASCTLQALWFVFSGEKDANQAKHRSASFIGFVHTKILLLKGFCFTVKYVFINVVKHFTDKRCNLESSQNIENYKRQKKKIRRIWNSLLKTNSKHTVPVEATLTRKEVEGGSASVLMRQKQKEISLQIIQEVLSFLLLWQHKMKSSVWNGSTYKRRQALNYLSRTTADMTMSFPQYAC